jgi:RNA polymerase sigma-70 factor (ECF subfamily)
MLGLFRRYGADAARFRLGPVLINGGLGVLAEAELPDGSRLRGTMAFAVAGGRLTGVFNQANPAKLVQVPPELWASNDSGRSRTGRD